jgi:hypothetical protein
MGVIYDQVLIHYLDNNGTPATAFITTQEQGSGGAGAYSALAAAFQAVSDAKVVAVQFQSTLHLTGTAGSGPYETAFDRGVLLGNIPATGAPAKVSIIAPKAAIFLPDTVTIDLSNLQILALQTQIMALAGDRNGNPWGPFKRGMRTEARS